MSRHLAAIFTIGALSVGGLIMAENLGEGDLPEFLRRFDTNNDDQIDEEERQAIRDLRSKLRNEDRESIDLDDDGIISPGEVVSARKKIRRLIQERRSQKFRSIAGEDEVISPSEYRSIPGIDTLPDLAFELIWQHLDIDADGNISLAEFTGALRSHE